MSKVLLMAELPERMLQTYVDALTASFPDIALDAVGSRQAALPHLPHTEILITFAPVMSDEVLQRAPRLKWIQALGTGVDNLIDQPSLRGDVIVTNMRGIHGAPVAEAAISSMLALSRNIPQFVRNQGNSEWKRWPARLLTGKTVGILGVGVIAEHLAPLCKAFGMKVVGIASEQRHVDGFDEVHARRDMLSVAGTFDYLVVLAPYTEATHNLVNADLLNAMKPSAFLINVARGGVVDESALEAALNSGTIAGAALDVFVQEPLPGDHPFWSMQNVLITTHQAGFCDVYPELALPVIKQNLRTFLSGNVADMINQVSH